MAAYNGCTSSRSPATRSASSRSIWGIGLVIEASAPHDAGRGAAHEHVHRRLAVHHGDDHRRPRSPSPSSTPGGRRSQAAEFMAAQPHRRCRRRRCLRRRDRSRSHSHRNPTRPTRRDTPAADTPPNELGRRTAPHLSSAALDGSPPSTTEAPPKGAPGDGRRSTAGAPRQRGDPHDQPARGAQRDQRRRRASAMSVDHGRAEPTTPSAGSSSSPAAGTRRSAPAWTSRPSAAARRATSSGRAAASPASRQRDFPKPLIAAVNGSALAGGFEIMLSCDLVVAADHATLRHPRGQARPDRRRRRPHPHAQAPPDGDRARDGA